jgi:hypothetical protein
MQLVEVEDILAYCGDILCAGEGEPGWVLRG